MLLCDWVFPRVLKGFDSQADLEAADDYYGDVEAEAKMLAPLTGLEITSADLDKVGDRIRNLDRALHIRNYDRSKTIDSTGEWVYEYPQKTDGTKLDRPLFDRILESYYKVRGWDQQTGRPTRATLEALGLTDVADELDSLGKLGQP